MSGKVVPVKLKAATVKRLRKFGEFGDSYDAVVNKVLDKAEGKAR